MRFVYVILQYGCFDVTQACIKSIFDYATHSPKIVVVDNCSPDDAGTRLREYALTDSRIHTLFMGQNLGFSNGNNAGYEYAVKELQADFVIMVNNDTEVFQADFEDRILDSYAKNNYAVLGPDIICPHHFYSHQSPLGQDENFVFHINKPSLDDIDKMILQAELNLRESEARINDSVPVKLVEGQKRSIKDIKALAPIRRIHQNYIQAKEKHDYEKAWQAEYGRVIEDVLISGACFIFSPNYIKIMEKALWPETFMYFEETLLQFNCMEYGLRSIFDPSVKIIHRSGVSTSQFTDSEKKKLITRQRFLEALHVVRKRRSELGLLGF